MHLLFVDESGTPPKRGTDRQRYFVVGGIIIPEAAWRRVHEALLGMKTRRKLRGELKWRFFSEENTDDRNPMRHMTGDQRNEIRAELYGIIRADASIKAMAVVTDVKRAYERPAIVGQAELYHATYKPMTERFQYYLQDMTKLIGGGQRQFGIVVGDHRDKRDDKGLRAHHQKLLYASSQNISTYKNLVESLFLQPSIHSVGIQFADLVAGAVYRKFERGDSRWYDVLELSLRRRRDGVVDGYGIIMFPKGKADDAG